MATTEKTVVIGGQGGSVSHSETLTELLYLIQRFLQVGPCHRSAEVLRQEIEQQALLPVRRDFAGGSHERLFDDYDRLFRCTVRPDALLAICHRIRPLLDAALPPSVAGLPPLLIATGRQSLLRTAESIAALRRPFVENAVRFKGAPVHARRPNHAVHALVARQLTGSLPVRTLFPKETPSKLELHCRILGHLSSVFCVAFDQTGQFIFTGADDNLVKVWSAHTGLLRFTFRGHSAEIADLSVSFDNSLLAAGSIDKSVRVWCLQTGAALYVFRCHTAMVTLLNFLPYVYGDDRYLVSTGSDCITCFYKWNGSTKEFAETPTKFHERVTTGARIISSCYSPGGNFVVTGCTDHYVRIYRITSDYGVVKLTEMEAHTDRVDSLVWAYDGLKFASGSKDGCAKVWTFVRSEWQAVLLKADVPIRSDQDKDKNKYKVTMICWSLNDQFVITTGSDHLLRVWDSRTGAQIRTMAGHKDEVFVLDAHPLNPELVMSAGHDGLLILWDYETGAVVRRYHNLIDGSGHGAFFDASFSPNEGSLMAAVDSHGHLSIFGIGSNQLAKMMPKEQFFHTDYRPLMMDAAGFVLDEQTQLAPNVMPPPFLVDADGQPYPAEVQRLVPGKERCAQTFLQQQRVRRTDETASVDIENEPADRAAEVPAPSDERDDTLLCAWIRRPVVKLLPPNLLSEKLARLTLIGDDEYERFNAECAKQPLPKAPSAAAARPVDAADSRRPAARRRAAPAAAANGNANGSERAYATRTNRRPPAVYSADDIVEPNQPTDQSESSGSEFNSSSSSASDSDSDSDYSGSGADVPGPSKSAGRRRRLRRDGDEEEEEGDENGAGGSDASVHSDAGDESILEKQPSTSSNSKSKRKAAAPRRKQRPLKSNRTKTSPALESLRSFPEWLSMIAPRKFPFFPQLGDRAVYFRQGHQNYIDAVVKNELYHVTAKMQPLPELDAEEFVLVDDVKFARHPYRLTCLRLAQTDRSGNRTGVTFTVRYHDLDGIPDFIVLRHHYEESVKRKWKPGDRIQAVLDQQWWTGTVDKREPIDDDFPRSNWLTLVVKWDTGEDEVLSPWDVEPAPPGRRRTGGEENATTTEELATQAKYDPLPGEWPDHGRDTECRRLSDAIEALGELETVEPFVAPVSLVEYPEYTVDIDYPIDLSTIRRRLNNSFYRRSQCVEFDVRYLAVNAATFNLADSVIVRNARTLVETILRFIRVATPPTNIVQLYHEICELPDSELIEWRRRKTHSGLADDSSASSALSTAPWMIECERVMAAVMAHESATHFLNQENPELSSVFDSALDLSTIAVQLERGDFDSPEAFSEVVNNLLQNCRSMADNQRSPIFRDALRLEGLFKEQMSGIIAKWHRLNCAEQQSRPQRDDGGERRLRRKPGLAHVYNTRSSRPSTIRSSGVASSSSSLSARPRPQFRPTLAYESSRRSSRGNISVSAHRYSPPDSRADSRSPQPSTSSAAGFGRARRAAASRTAVNGAYAESSDDERRRPKARPKPKPNHARRIQSSSEDEHDDREEEVEDDDGDEDERKDVDHRPQVVPSNDHLPHLAAREEDGDDAGSSNLNQGATNGNGRHRESDDDDGAGGGGATSEYEESSGGEEFVDEGVDDDDDDYEEGGGRRPRTSERARVAKSRKRRAVSEDESEPSEDEMTPPPSKQRRTKSSNRSRSSRHPVESASRRASSRSVRKAVNYNESSSGEDVPRAEMTVSVSSRGRVRRIRQFS